MRSETWSMVYGLHLCPEHVGSNTKFCDHPIIDIPFLSKLFSPRLSKKFVKTLLHRSRLSDDGTEAGQEDEQKEEDVEGSEDVIENQEEPQELVEQVALVVVRLLERSPRTSRVDLCQTANTSAEEVVSQLLQ